MGLSGRLTVSGQSPVPVRVERPDGSLAAVTLSEPDGSWAVDVPDGQYVVRPRWMDPFEASTGPVSSASSGAVALASNVAVAQVAQSSTAIVDSGPVSWVVRYGDTAHSPIWAVLDHDGTALNLVGWVVRAQARETPLAEAMVKEWTLDNGVTIGTATVDLGNGTTVTTSTIQLDLDPGDYRWLPPSFSGVFDVEIELPSQTLGDPPVKRYTVVPEARLQIVPDVTRGDE